MKKKPLLFGDLLRIARNRSGFTQAELADKCGWFTQRIGALETGDRDNPSLDTINRLANALGISVADLLSGKSRRKQTA